MKKGDAVTTVIGFIAYGNIEDRMSGMQANFCCGELIAVGIGR